MRTRFKDICDIPMGRLALAAVAGGALLATNVFAQSAREVRGATPYLAIENEPPPKLIVDPRLPRDWPRVSSGYNIGWRMCASYKFSGQARSTYLHGSGICTYA